MDFALLVDGLSAEREQGITIDVAYRYFASEKRKFIVADTPGHEQYTRNMVTGASTADLAVLLVDARKGVLTQTRRHSYLGEAARHPPVRARGEQDGPGRVTTRARSTRSPPIIGVFAGQDRNRRVGRHSGFGADGRQCRHPKRDAMPWYDRPAFSIISNTVPLDVGPTPPSRCGCRCSGSTGQTTTSGVCRPDR